MNRNRQGLLRLVSALVLLAGSAVATASGAAAAPGPSHWHWGWAQSTVLEQFGVTATEDYRETVYTEDWANVYYPQFYDGYCYNSGFPGWSRKACAYRLYDYTPDWVAIDGWSNWTNAFCRCDYGQYEYYQADWTGWWTYGCSLYYGSLPYGWDFRCYGGRY